jgi:peptidoglycan hydrolase-like protein with peptidoglycan-binding domain
LPCRHRHQCAFSSEGAASRADLARGRRCQGGDARAASAKHAVRTATDTANQARLQLIANIQRELTRKGFYDGPADGIWGSKTDSAVRDFIQAAGLKINAEPSDGLLRTVSTSSAKPSNTGSVSNTAADPIARLIAPSTAPLVAPSKRITAVQRALADFGFGQIKPTGVLDADTRAAVEKFERERRLPVDGQISDRLVRELAGMTGRPLE